MSGQPNRPEFKKVTLPDGTEDYLINRAGLELILEHKVEELAAAGFSFDFIAEWVAQRRCWLGIDK